MLNVSLDEEKGSVTLEPDGALTKQDFESAAQRIDPYIERAGGLRGLLIHTRSFPGWDSFGALVTHLKFVKEHQRKIARVALVTDSAIGDVAERLVSHFVSAEIKHFPFDDLAAARDWVSAE